MKNTIAINLKKDQIIITINEKSNQEDIKKALKKKLPDLKKLYQEEKTPIFICGKVLKNKEMKEIKQMIEQELDVEVEFDSPRELGLSRHQKILS